MGTVPYLTTAKPGGAVPLFGLRLRVGRIDERFASVLRADGPADMTQAKCFRDGT